MKQSKTTWHYSLETEADRLIQAAAQTANRFYPKHDFLVLPKKIGNKGKVVYLPYFNFQEIADFWLEVKKASLDIPMPVKKKIHQQVVSLLRKKKLILEKEKVSQLKVAWKKKKGSFWKALLELFPHLAKKTITLEIRPTSFGSLSSFNLVDLKKKKLMIKIYLRLDMSIGHIAEAILSSLLSQTLTRQGYSWEEKEAVVDFLLNFTPLKELFPDYQPTLDQIRSKEEGQLAIESQKYLKKLGLPVGEIFSIKEKQILIDKKTPREKFSLNEEKVLKLLIKNKNNLCSFDQIGEIIWQENSYDSFSIWAITKLIQRIRNKIKDNGLSPALIQAQRGKGYVLRN